MKFSLTPILLAGTAALLFVGCATQETHRLPPPQPLPPPTVRKPTPLPPPTVRRPAPTQQRPPATVRKSTPSRTQAREIVVTEAPPNPVAETATRSPGKGYAWIPGS